MDTSLRKPIILTVVLLVALTIILVIIANGAAQNSQGMMNLFSIVIILALIALVWFRYIQDKNLTPGTVEKPKQETPSEMVLRSPTNDEEQKTTVPKDESSHSEQSSSDATTTRTGQTCTVSGSYVCSEHPDKNVEMIEGKRFPPCRGDGSGHSAVWVLHH